MKRYLLSLLLIVAVAAATNAAAGTIQLAADAAGTNCLIGDAPGVVKLHMIVFNEGSVMAVQFQAPKPACWAGATWLGDEHAFPVTIGDTQNSVYNYGIAIAFGHCESSPIYLGSIVFQTAGNSAPCCYYPVLKADDRHPEIPGPIMVPCPDNIHDPGTYVIEGFSGGAIINPSDGCNCLSTTPTENSTWGAVKELYR